jgi:hypothetical protein
LPAGACRAVYVPELVCRCTLGSEFALLHLFIYHLLQAIGDMGLQRVGRPCPR